jgi:hypothetical protein
VVAVMVGRQRDRDRGECANGERRERNGKSSHGNDSYGSGHFDLL